MSSPVVYNVKSKIGEGTFGQVFSCEAPQVTASELLSSSPRLRLGTLPLVMKEANIMTVRGLKEKHITRGSISEKTHASGEMEHFIQGQVCNNRELYLSKVLSAKVSPT